MKTWFVLIFVTCLSLNLTSVHKEFPQSDINKRILNDLKELGALTKEFEEALQDQDDLITQYLKIRLKYKAIETYVVFRYPGLDKAINGGPVPSMETEVVILHKDDPHGLQVMEELLTQSDVDLQSVQKELRFIAGNIRVLEQSVNDLPLQHWEILEANHMAVSRLMTLSLTGFDSPELVNGLQDAKVVLSTMKADFVNFNTFFRDIEGCDAVIRLCDEAIRYLTNTPSFDALDHFTCYRDYLIPLQNAIKTYHRNSSFEFYSDVSTIPRAIGKGSNLFSVDYLDPVYSMRGAVKNLDPEKVKLGKILFHDPILSGNNKRACASCHNASKAFSDGRQKSLAMDGQQTVLRNSPGLINAGFQSNFFWDLRSENMNDQIMHVILDSKEFNTTAEEMVNKLKQSNEYVTLFRQAYPGFKEPVNLAAIKSSLELYVRSLYAFNSKFDRNIRGEEDSYTAQEHLGANLFFGKAACATCHFAPVFNGYVPPHYRDTEGDIIGVESAPNSGEPDLDKGMYNRFRLVYEDANYINGMFKTSTVRNIALTAPYMHNGMYETLEDVVDFYNDGGGSGRGINIPQQTLSRDSLGLNALEKEALVAFMKTLTDTCGTHTKPFLLPVYGDNRDKRVWGGEY